LKASPPTASAATAASRLRLHATFIVAPSHLRQGFAVDADRAQCEQPVLLVGAATKANAMKQHDETGIAIRFAALLPRRFARWPIAAAAAGWLGAVLGLTTAGPAVAQLPRPAAVAPPPEALIDVLDLVTTSSALALKRNHIDVEIDGTEAQVRTTLIYRNDSSATVLARFALPWQDVAIVTAMSAATRAGSIDSAARSNAVAQARAMSALAWQADNCSADQELAEAGESPSSLGERNLTRVAPGESVAVSWRRRVQLIQRAGHYRLVLPLAGERGRAFRPSFSASVRVASERRVVELSSGSHRARVAGVGTQQASLTVAPVRAREGQFFALDFRLQPANAQERIRKLASDKGARDAPAGARADRGKS
jgi:hypothetical protein